MIGAGCKSITTITVHGPFAHKLQSTLSSLLYRIRYYSFLFSAPPAPAVRDPRESHKLGKQPTQLLKIWKSGRGAKGYNPTVNNSHHPIQLVHVAHSFGGHKPTLSYVGSPTFGRQNLSYKLPVV